MRAFLLPILVAASLAGCIELQTAVDSTARRGVKNVVIETLATRFPQVPKELLIPFTDCVVDNATAVEVRTFIGAATGGVDETTVATVRTILARPETRSCLQTRAQASGIV